MHKILNLINKEFENNEVKSNNILIHSPFGQGKTTLKNSLKEKLSTDKKYIVYDVNIWENEKTDIIDNILLTILMETPEIFDDCDLLKNISTLILTRLNKIKKLKEIIGDLCKTKYSDFITKMKENYYLDNISKKIFNSLSEKFSDKKIIFLFDELDRCTEEYIKQFFSKIKVTFKYKNFVNLFFANKQVLNNVFSSLNINNQEYF